MVTLLVTGSHSGVSLLRDTVLHDSDADCRQYQLDVEKQDKLEYEKHKSQKKTYKYRKKRGRKMI